MEIDLRVLSLACAKLIGQPTDTVITHICIYIFIYWGLDIKNQYCLSKCYLSLVLVFLLLLTIFHLLIYIYIYIFGFNFAHNIYCNYYELNVFVWFLGTAAGSLVVNTPDHALAIARLPLAGEDAYVGASEGGIAQGVAHGIYCGVDVAQGIEEVPQLGGYAVRAGGQRLDQHQYVVRCPRDDEAQQYCREGFGRLRFLSLLL